MALQQQQWLQRMGRRSTDSEVLEILQERREAIQSGRLKKKRLLEAFEGANHQINLRPCSPIVIHDGENVSCFCCFSSSTSDDDHGFNFQSCADGDGDDEDEFYNSSASTSSSPEEMTGENRSVGDIGQWVSRISWVGSVAILIPLFVLISAIKWIASCQSGEKDVEGSLIPT